MAIKHALIGNLLTGAFGRIIGGLTPMLLIPFMIRTWGLEVYGEWLILTAIPAYIMLAPDFGLAGAVVNRMAYLTAEGHEQEAVYIYRSSFIVLFLAASGFVCLGWLIAWWFNWSRVGVHTLGATTSTLVIGLSCVKIFIAQQSFLLSGIYRSARRNPRLGLLQSANQLVLLGISLVVLLFGSSPSQFVLAQVIAHALFIIVLFVDSRRIMPVFTLSRHGVSLKRIQPYIVPGLGHAGMPFVNALQNQGVLIVLGTILGPAYVGIFQTARVLTNGVKSLIGLFSSAIIVELPALLGEERKDLIERILILNSQIGTLLAMIAITIMTFAGEAIYRVWLGDQVPYDFMMVCLLLLSLFPFAVARSYLLLLQAGNLIHFAILPLIAVAFVSIVCVGIGALFWGISGATVGVLLWEVGFAIVAVIIAAYNYINLRSYLSGCLDIEVFFNNISQILSWIMKGVKSKFAKPDIT